MNPETIAAEYIRGYGKDAYEAAYKTLQATKDATASKVMARVCELILKAKERR